MRRNRVGVSGSLIFVCDAASRDDGGLSRAWRRFEEVLVATPAGWMRALWWDRRGVTAVEYGLIVALVAVVIVSSLTRMGLSLSGVFSTAATKL